MTIIMMILGFVWRFITSKVGQILMVALALIYLGYRLEAKHVEATQAEAAVAAQQLRIDALQRDLANINQVASDAAQHERVTAASVAELKQRIDAYEAELSKRPDPHCALSRADVRRLRRFHTKP